MLASDGKFLGVVAAATDIAYLQDFYRAIVAGSGQTVTLLRRDGIVMAQYPDTGDAIGTSMPMHSPWYGIVAKEGGTYRSPGFFVARPSLVAVRPLRDYPLVVDVVIAVEDALTSWRSGVIEEIKVASVFILAILGAFWMLSRLLRNQDRQNAKLAQAVDNLHANEIALRQSRSRLALATKSARIGIWDWDVVNNVLVWDSRMYELYGIHEHDFSGAYDAWQAGLHPEDRTAGEAGINDALNGFREFDIEFRVLWPSGEVRHIEAHASVHRASDGHATRMVGANWDITQRKLAEREIERMGRHDDLTGLVNRRVFVDVLEHTVARAHRSGTTFAVMFLDLDHFKDVNDSLGHLMGDIVLQQVAQRLRGNLREVDTVARFGGDEFAILLDDISDTSDGTVVSERILEVLSEQIVVRGMGAAVVAVKA